jgi:hypothetical protein
LRNLNRFVTFRAAFSTVLYSEEMKDDHTTRRY